MKALLLFLFFPILAQAAGKIIDVDIAPAGTANIARNKLASGTNYAWCVNNSTGVMTSTAVTASRAVATDANGSPVASATTATELGYVNGVTSAIQTQLNGKQASISNQTASSHQWFNSFTAGTFGGAQPAFSDVSGTLGYSQGGTNATTSWTQGSVFFASASAFAQDNANFFWDATNHRLGVGTASPGYDIDLEAQTGASGTIFMSRRSDHHGWLLSVTTSPYFTLQADNGNHTSLSLQPAGIWNFDRGSENGNASTYSFGHSYDETSTNVLMTLWGTSASYSGDLFRWYDSTATPTLKGHIDSAGKFYAAGGVQVSSLSTGIGHYDASGNLTSSAVDLSSADATGTLAAGRFPALTGDITTSAGSLATTLKNTGPGAGSYTNANITIDAQGRVTAASNGSGASAPTSEVTVDGGNGNGSTNTKVFRWTNTRKNAGSNITYADSATNGGSFTINASGIFAVSLCAVSASALNFGIVINGANGTTNANSLTYAQGLRAIGFAAATDQECISWTGHLSTNDVVWAQGDGNNPTNSSNTMLTVTQVF